MNTKENTIINKILYPVTGLALWLSMNFLPGWMTVVILIAGAAMMIIDFHPEMFLLLLIVAVPFEVKQDVIGSFTIHTTEGILFMGVITWLWLVIKKNKIKLPDKKLTVSAGVFFFAVILSLFFTESFTVSVKQAVRWLEIFAVYFFVISFISEGRKLEFIIKFIVIMGLLTALTGLYQFVNNGFDFRSTVSLFGNYDPFAGYLGLIIPLTLVMFLRKNSIPGKLWSGVIFFVLLFALAATFSRGGWVGGVAAFIPLIVFSRSSVRKQLLYTGAAILVVFLLVLKIMPSTFQQPGLRDIQKSNRLVVGLADYSVRKRLEYWKSAIESIKEKPLLGTGIGNYQRVHRKYGITLISDADFWAGDEITTLKKLEPNIFYSISMEYRVVQGDIGCNDFIEMIKYADTGESRVFETPYPNVIMLRHNNEWTPLEGAIHTTTRQDLLSGIKLRWAHDQKSSVKFRNLKVVPDKGGNPAPVELDYSYFHLHSLYIQLLVETGVIGLAAFLYFVIIHLKFLLVGLRNAGSSETGNNYIFGLGCLCGVIAFLTHSFVDILMTHSIGVSFAMILGIAVLSVSRLKQVQ